MFEPFILNEVKYYLPCTDIDPDCCYYDDLSYSIQDSSIHFSEDSFNYSLLKVFQNSDLFSLIHLSERRIAANLSNLLQYMSNLNVNLSSSKVYQKHGLLKQRYFDPDR